MKGEEKMSEAKNKNGWTGIMRWTARILALVAIGLFVLFMVESGAATISQLSFTNPQGIPVLLSLLLALVGVIVAWRWELVGGILTIVGALGIIGLVCLGSGTDMLLCSLFFTGPLLIAGILYLACCYRTRQITPA
jgi:hypothetical protein